MYAPIRQQALDRCDWKGSSRDGRLPLQYVEAWRYDGTVQADSTSFTTGNISSETELRTWLLRTNTPSHQQPRGKLLSSIKLLVCDRRQYKPLDLSLSPSDFILVERTFRLSPLTVPSLESEPGTYSRFLHLSKDDQSKLKRIDTIMKAPQKREILNWGLSLSYDVESSTTTGLLYGTGLNLQSPDPEHDRYKQCQRSPLQQFVASIEAASELWGHPMLLPSLFLSEHLSCTNVFCAGGKVWMETVRIEQALGVTKVGESGYLASENKDFGGLQPGSRILTQHMRGPSRGFQEPPVPPRILTREETESLTVQINTQSTRVAFTARSPEWNLACSHFILKTLDDIEPHLSSSHQTGQHECKQLIEHNITLAEAAASNIAVIEKRMALQLNVLYNFVAQLDNQTSAELAASASRDSTSMKILAFISALFLPGSFISGMFSMGIFDWHGENNAILSNKFYIYWAIAVPLTIITVLGWAAWWKFELGRFDRKIGNIRKRPDKKSTTKQEA